jgi:hypothetical protein
MTPDKQAGNVTEKLDIWLRFCDFESHRTVGGRLARWFGIGRHSLPAVTLPALLCGFMVMASPTPMRAGMALVTTAVAAAVLVALLRRSCEKRRSLRHDLLLEFLVVGVVAAVVWLVGGDTYTEGTVYRNLLLPMTVAVGVGLVVASGLVDLMFRRLRQQSCYGEYLKKTELFASSGEVSPITIGTVLTAIATALFRAPLGLLTAPGIAAIITPPVWYKWAALCVFVVCFAAFVIAGLNERFGAMWNLRLRVFFTGGSLLVSVIVTALGAARFAGVDYVTTVFDTAAWHTIGALLAFAYVLSWWYDYWSNRLLADQILGLLDHEALGEAEIDYEIDPRDVHTSVRAQGRKLQVLGAARFVVLNDNPLRFQAWAMNDLIWMVAVSGAPGGKAVPTPLQIRGRMFNFHVVAALLLFGLMGGGAFLLNRGPQLAEATVLQPAPGLSLESTMFGNAAVAADRPLYVIAASGGGTRAALYTAAVLEALARVGKTADIVLGSGVSGGGAALAYYAANREALDRNDIAAWETCFETMKQAYIRDVLERSSEWRMVGPGRLGILLRQSFLDHWNLKPGRQNLMQVRDMGLIFNTSIAGHLELPSKERSGKPLWKVEPEYRKHYTKSTLAGGRLLLTNLDLKDLAAVPLEPDARRLPIIVSGPEVRLEEAAALNANFPPVFANAAIDTGNRVRYWVTDGGAVDNRGMEMLLFALRLALEKRPAGKLPKIHVIVADASALSDGFSQDRGIGSVAGAGSHFASHLDAELVAGIRRMYGTHGDRFEFSYLMMPDRLRVAGSFGTHWMLQSSIDVKLDAGDQVISGEEMIGVLRAVFRGASGQSLSAGACRVLEAVQKDVTRQPGWKHVLDIAGASSVPVSCQ